jgi:hypothetical protein
MTSAAPGDSAGAGAAAALFTLFEAVFETVSWA